jgi:anti-sigma regulatory factor (Ser/Thr protein kinase)
MVKVFIGNSSTRGVNRMNIMHRRRFGAPIFRCERVAGDLWWVSGARCSQTYGEELMTTRAHPEFAMIEVPAAYASFDRIAAFAEARVGDWSRSDALRLVLVLEELFTNSVGHGYAGETEMPVRLGCCRKGKLLQVVYEDEAPPFDPRSVSASASLPGADGLLPERVGGLGLWLVRHYVRDYLFEREEKVNRTTFTMQPGEFSDSN